MEDSFSATYADTLFGSRGLLTTPGSLDGGIFKSGMSDPTKIMQTAGISILLGLMIFQLFKSLFGEYIQSESPDKVITKGLAYCIAISFYHIWSNALLKLVISPIFKSFKNVETSTVAATAGTDVSNCFHTMYQNVERWGNNPDEFLSKFGTIAERLLFESEAVLRGVLFLILCIPLGIKFVSFSFEVVERYIQIFFITILGPVCMACGISPKLEHVSKRWFSTWLNSMLILCLNMFFIKLSIIATTNFIAGLAETIDHIDLVRDVVIPFVAVYSLMKIAGEIDDIADKVGLNNVGAIGAGSALWAGLRRSKNLYFGNELVKKNVFAGENMKSVAQNGSKAAAFASAVGSKGVVGATVATLTTVVSKTARGAMVLDAQEKIGMKNAIFDNAERAGKNFSQNLANASGLKKSGVITGSRTKQALTSSLNAAGYEGNVINAHMDKGFLYIGTNNGDHFLMRPAESEDDMFGSDINDKNNPAFDNGEFFNINMDGVNWTGVRTGEIREEDGRNGRDA